MHDADRVEDRQRAQQAGGRAKANARRAAKQWTAIGETIESTDLPAILKSCIFAVRDGDMEPAQANAIMGLAKASVAISSDIELEQRIAALEEAAGLVTPPANVRRIAS